MTNTWPDGCGAKAQIRAQTNQPGWADCAAIHAAETPAVSLSCGEVAGFWRTL
ncbi:MAG: hypothetical protein ACK4VZ_10975 [Paracoccaceae bacterium]